MTDTLLSMPLSVIIPTRNEAGNVHELVTRLNEVLAPTSEILFVDDSTDETPQTIMQVADKSLVPVKLLHRKAEHRTGGLGGAVVHGLRHSRCSWAIVMDGDLQHPPETIRKLAGTLARDKHDIVVASRYCAEGSAGGLDNGIRHLVSSGSTSLAKLLFRRNLRYCTDPMTGFFALRRDAVDVDTLHPQGFKILLEILARQPLRIAEVPFTFQERYAGESKANVAEGLTFIKQISRLWLDRKRNRAMFFAAAGVTGILVNLLALACFLDLGLHYLVAATLATQIAITWNFLLIDRPFRPFRRHDRHGPFRRYVSFLGISNSDLIIRLPLMWLLVDILSANVYLATLISIVIAFIFRFMLSDHFIYGKRPAPPTREEAPAIISSVLLGGEQP